MAKYINNKVKSGRVAGSVFAVRFGEVIERAYNPYVSNPKSLSQIESRAKLKLLSQLSAVMAPVLAFPRVGAVSSRNQFTSKNYGVTGFSDNQATIQLTSVQLTKSVVGLPQIFAQVSEENLSVQLQVPAQGLSRVVYCMFAKQADSKLRFVSSNVVSVAGNFNTFPTTFNLPNESVVIYAYGIRDNTEAANVLFGELVAPTAEQVAKIIVTRQLTDADITVTETRGTEYNPA